MILYFSGTGNSRFAAKFLARELQEEWVDIGQEIKGGTPGSFHSDRPWVIVSPTYGWRLPRIVTDYVRRSVFSGSQKLYTVLTCGSDIGNAEKGIEELCREKHLHPCGVLEVVMPENYIAMFPVPGREEAERIVEEAKPVLQQAVARIRREEQLPPRHISAADRLKSGLVNDCFYRFLIKADPFRVTEACVGCGACVEACPLNNLQLREGVPVWGDACTHCMSCICGCPTEAIEYGRRSWGKPRYQCPVELEERAERGSAL